MTPPDESSRRPALPPWCEGRGVVAVLRLPIPVDALSEVIRSMTATYGPGLLMEEQPKGWLTFLMPENGPNGRDETEG